MVRGVCNWTVITMLRDGSCHVFHGAVTGAQVQDAFFWALHISRVKQTTHLMVGRIYSMGIVYNTSLG